MIKQLFFGCLIGFFTWHGSLAAESKVLVLDSQHSSIAFSIKPIGLKDVYGQFVAAVAEQRQLSHQITRELAQGQIYTGKAAKTHQLIDQLGGYNVALTALASQVGIKGDPTIIKKDKLGFTSFLSAWKDQLSFNWQSLIFPTMTMTY